MTAKCIGFINDLGNLVNVLESFSKISSIEDVDFFCALGEDSWGLRG